MIAHPLFLVLKEIIIIIIIIPEILFDTEYIAFSVYFPIISVSSVIELYCLIWTKFVQFPRAACSITLIAYGDVF